MCLNQLNNYYNRKSVNFKKRSLKQMKNLLPESDFFVILGLSGKSGSRSHLYHCSVQTCPPCPCSRQVFPELAELFSPPLADSELWAVLFSTFINTNLVSALQLSQSRRQAWKEKLSRPTLLVLLFMMLCVQRPFEEMVKTHQGVLLHPIRQRNVWIWAYGEKIG